MKFKFLVEGDHPMFMRIDRRCLSLEEAENVVEDLESLGYECKIILINNKEEVR